MSKHAEYGAESKPTPRQVYDQDAMRSLSLGVEYEAFLRTGGRRLRPRIEVSLAMAQVEQGMMVLDLGCGKGEVVLRCARIGATVVGSDYSSDCLELTRHTLNEIGDRTSSQVLLAMADAKSLPFADGTFDRVFLLDVIEHLHEWEAAQTLAELRRVLKDDGYILMHTVPNKWALTVGYRLARIVFRGLPPDPRSDLEKVVHVNEQDIVELHRLIASSGLSCKVWLDGTIGKQAEWSHSDERGQEARNLAYSILRSRVMRGLYRFFMRGPMRLCFANDIYAMAWRSEHCGPSWGPISRFRIEGIVIRLSSAFAGGRLNGSTRRVWRKSSGNHGQPGLHL